jgi:peptide-methionine (S)-S-oxide reductase
MQTAVFGGGCFWCTEAVFLMLRGVAAVEPGYAGGTTKNPTYEEVSTGRTGHVECIKITYNEREIAYRDLLTVFFASHDPTSRDRQGNDVGPQYRSAVFYTMPEQGKEALAFVAELSAVPEESGKPIVTEIAPLETFWPAEDYHRKYYENHKDAPYCQLVIDPKVDKIRIQFEKLLKEHAK